MANFVYPTYFESFHKPDTVRFDHLNKINKPFQIHPGDYLGVYKERQVDPDIRFCGKAEALSARRPSRRPRRAAGGEEAAPTIRQAQSAPRSQAMRWADRLGRQ
jgi:hypothetical protein